MINVVGIKTLYKKDVMRFLRVYNQVIIAPIINALLFFMIFTIAIPHDSSHIANYKLFLIPGLIMMSIINSAYNNGVFIVLNKITGLIIDFVTIPLKSNEIIFSLCAGSVTRAVTVAILIYITLSISVMSFPMFNFWIVVLYAFISSLLCALIGLIVGLLFDSFDESSTITNYIITPLSFLSGTFYSIAKLPDFFQKIIHLNPFFYMMDGLRYGILGLSETSLFFGFLFILICSASLWYSAYWILESGYKIRK